MSVTTEIIVIICQLLVADCGLTITLGIICLAAVIYPAFLLYKSTARSAEQIYSSVKLVSALYQRTVCPVIVFVSSADVYRPEYGLPLSLNL